MLNLAKFLLLFVMVIFTVRYVYTHYVRLSVDIRFET